jgi:hypothetical protein
MALAKPTLSPHRDLKQDKTADGPPPSRGLRSWHDRQAQVESKTFSAKTPLANVAFFGQRNDDPTSVDGNMITSYGSIGVMLKILITSGVSLALGLAIGWTV